jgi:hypothetical protein
MNARMDRTSLDAQCREGLEMDVSLQPSQNTETHLVQNRSGKTVDVNVSIR